MLDLNELPDSKEVLVAVMSYAMATIVRRSEWRRRMQHKSDADRLQPTTISCIPPPAYLKLADKFYCLSLIFLLSRSLHLEDANSLPLAQSGERKLQAEYVYAFSLCTLASLAACALEVEVIDDA